MDRTNLPAYFDILFPQGDKQDMARRRLQRKGYVYPENGWWKLQWRQDAIGPDGKLRRVKMSTVLGATEGMTERQAQREAYERVLKEVNQRELAPQSLMKISDFVTWRFKPEYVKTLKVGGQVHYESWLPHLVEAIGALSLREVNHGHLQKMCLGLLDKTYTRRKGGKAQPYSVQSALHLKNCASAVFSYAKLVGLYTGENPASAVRLPELARKPKHSLTIEQVKELLNVLPSPVNEMARMALSTGMNVAEIVGLTWADVNATAEAKISEGDLIPAMAILPRRQWSRRRGPGTYHTLKASGRLRIIAITSELSDILGQLKSREKFTLAEDPVFACRTGGPVDAHNFFNTKLKPAGVKLGMPWLGWHTFRHTYATWIRQAGSGPSDQMAMLGHRDLRMTMHYGEQDLERRRAVTERITAYFSTTNEVEEAQLAFDFEPARKPAAVEQSKPRLTLVKVGA